MSTITLRQIQFALAVSRHKHFKRAAEECNISQSALSLGIAEMEKNLGVTIFERNNKQVVITSIGEEILKRAQQIFLDTQQLVERAHAGQEMLSFPLTIGFIPTIAPYLLPFALPIIREQHPNFALTIQEDISDRLINAVQNGTIDAAVIALPYSITGLNSFEFANETFYVIAHQNNPLSQLPRITNKQLRNGDLLLLSEGHCLKDQIMEICKLRNSMNSSNFREASLNTLIHMAANDMGVTLVPEIALPFCQHIPNAKTIPLDVKGPHRRLAIVTRPNYPRTVELEYLMMIFRQSIDRIRQQNESIILSR